MTLLGKAVGKGRREQARGRAGSPSFSSQVLSNSNSRSAGLMTSSHTQEPRPPAGPRRGPLAARLRNPEPWGPSSPPRGAADSVTDSLSTNTPINTALFTHRLLVCLSPRKADGCQAQAWGPRRSSGGGGAAGLTASPPSSHGHPAGSAPRGVTHSCDFSFFLPVISKVFHFSFGKTYL